MFEIIVLTLLAGALCWQRCVIEYYKSFFMTVEEGTRGRVGAGYEVLKSTFPRTWRLML